MKKNRKNCKLCKLHFAKMTRRIAEFEKRLSEAEKEELRLWAPLLDAEKEDKG